MTETLKKNRSKKQRESVTSESGDAKPSSRSIRRQRVRVELISVALDLFKKKGFDATTINDIADVVGMSPRTFFRYFKTKEDLVFDWMDWQGEILRPALEEGTRTESALHAMERAFLALAEKHDADKRRTNFLTHLIFDTPSLIGRFHNDEVKWQKEFVDILTRQRKLDSDQHLQIRVQVAAAAATFVAAIRAWADSPRSSSLKPWVIDAFVALRRGNA